MNKKFTFPLALLFLLLLLIIKSCSSSNHLPLVTFQSHKLPLLLCQTPKERHKWLKGRSTNHNGLCVLDFGYTSKHSFHTYHVYIPLVAYGVDSNGIIQNSFHPEPYNSSQEVTDLKGYESEKEIRFFYFLPKKLEKSIGLKIGDKVKLFETNPLVFQAEFENKKRINLLLAYKSEDRQRGLMHRKFLQDGEGMLFIFPKAEEQSFWMKNCKIPMSLAYIDSKNTIGEIHEMHVPPKGVPEEKYPRYHSKGEFDKVLEVPKGWFKEKGIKVGEKLKFIPPLSTRDKR